MILRYLANTVEKNIRIFSAGEELLITRTRTRTRAHTQTKTWTKQQNKYNRTKDIFALQ